MITTIAGVVTLVLFVCLIVYVAVAAGLRPKSLDRKKNALVITLLSLLSIAGLTGYLFSSHLLSEGRAELYLAIHCLRQDEFDGAHDKLINAQAQDGENFEIDFLNAMLYLKQRDYASSLEYIQRIEQEQNLSQPQQQLFERLRLLAPAYVTDPAAGAEEYEALCSAMVQFLNLSVSTKTRCDKYYEIEHSVEVLQSTGMRDFTTDISERIGDFKARYPDNRDIDYLKIRYHVVNQNYPYAVSTVEELLAESDSLYNRVLYADVLLQDLYAGTGSVFPTNSPDSQRYNAKADELGDQIAALRQELSGELSERKRASRQEKLQKLLDQQQDYRSRAKQVPAEQILNYVGAKRGFFGDRTGVYNLLGAKTYYSMGNLEKADEYLTELAEHVRYLSGEAPVRIALTECLELAAQCGPGADPKILARYEDTVRLLAQKGGCVSPCTGDYLNADFTEYLSEFLLNYVQQQGAEGEE